LLVASHHDTIIGIMAETTSTTRDFVVNPIIEFETQQEGEKVILLLRAHLVTQIPWVLLVIILLILPAFIGSILSLVSINLFSLIPARFVGVITAFYYLLVFGYAFERFLKWYFNVYLLTNERIVDFDFYGVLYKAISDARLSQIQDVSAKTIGAIATFFNYGDILVQTAAESQEFEFLAVPKPDVVVRRITEELQKEEGEPLGAVM